MALIFRVVYTAGAACCVHSRSIVLCTQPEQVLLLSLPTLQISTPPPLPRVGGGASDLPFVIFSFLVFSTAAWVSFLPKVT